MDFITEFIKLHNKDLLDAKFKIGTRVLVTWPQSVRPVVGKVQAVNFTNDMFEYAVEGAPYLAWEHEMEAIEEVH